ncbi:MAG: hypothetical protein H6619_04205 [Deltaproteobacteria bacterium]|nr:hypothetical protein [Deltaproteobacteria bacterium]
MDFEKIPTLIISKKQSLAEEISASLKKKLQIQECDGVRTLFQGIKKHPDNLYELCIITDEFSLGEAKEFFNDMKKTRHSDACVCVRVYESLPKNWDTTEDLMVGFHVSIDKALEMKDLDLLQRALQKGEVKRQGKKKVLKIEKSLEEVLDEIDKSAEDWKRGYHRSVKTIADRVIAVETSLDPELREVYYEQLIERSVEAEIPADFVELCIPEEILARKLPGMTEKGYQGASHRVWEILKERYGAEASKHVTAEDIQEIVAEVGEELVDQDEVTEEHAEEVALEEQSEENQAES